MTAISRADSKYQAPEGVKVASVSYDDYSSLVSALKGQQFLVITMSVLAPREIHSKFIRAAAEARVPYVMPNGYGMDLKNDSLCGQGISVDEIRADCAEIEATGVSSWISLVCGLWYEWSLANGPEWFGFDFKEKKLTFYDVGNTQINITTWAQCARAIAALVSLNELPKDVNDQSPTVSSWRNKPLYISSFLLNQKEIFESWKRVSGDQDKDWTFEYEPSLERRNKGLELFQQKGEFRGMARAMFSRCFFPNGDGNYESKHGLANTTLVLPRENLDELTEVVKEVIDSGRTYAMRRGLAMW